MVASMAYRDTEVAAVPDVAEGALVRTPPDWRRLYEQTLERAEAAEARAEELKWAEVVARSAAESLKWQFKEARRKRLAAVEDANGARRAAKNALFLEAEVARLTRLLGEAGVDPHPRGTEISLRREVARLRTVVAAQVQAHAELRKALRRSRRQKAALNALTKENAGLRRTAKASQDRVGDAGSGAVEAARDRGSAVRDAVRAPEREAGDAAQRTPSRPAELWSNLVYG